MRPNRRPSDNYAEAGETWVALDNAARLLDESKSIAFAQMCLRRQEIERCAVNKAEMLVKASPEWEAHIHKVVEAKTKANRAKVQLKVCEMKHAEAQSDAANERAMTRMSA